jgi:hypothetical protein
MWMTLEILMDTAHIFICHIQTQTQTQPHLLYFLSYLLPAHSPSDHTLLFLFLFLLQPLLMTFALRTLCVCNLFQLLLLFTPPPPSHPPLQTIPYCREGQAAVHQIQIPVCVEEVKIASRP